MLKQRSGGPAAFLGTIQVKEERGPGLYQGLFEIVGLHTHIRGAYIFYVKIIKIIKKSKHTL